MTIASTMEAVGMDGLTAGMQWWHPIPWLLTACTLAFAIFQWVRTRHFYVKIWISTSSGVGDGNEHKRFFDIDVWNLGADIHDIEVTLEVTVNNTTLASPLIVSKDLPNPMKFRQSRRFYAENDDPRSSCGFESISAQNIALEIRSGVRTIRRIKGSKFKAKLDKFSRVDKSLPPKPAPQQTKSSILGIPVGDLFKIST